MKSNVSIQASVGSPRGGRRWIGCRFAAVGFAAALAVSAPAYADSDPYAGYEDYYARPPARVIIPSPYTYDAVNRRSSLTPEPVWRSMFPGIRGRMAVEERTLGVPGDAEYEARYWRWWSRRARR